MKIKVKLHPNSSQEKVINRDNKKTFSPEDIFNFQSNVFNLEIWIKEKPLENGANIALIKKLKKYFKSYNSIKIVGGLKSKNKIIEVKN